VYNINDHKKSKVFCPILLDNYFMEQKQKIYLDISAFTVVKIIFIILLIFFLFAIKQIILILFFAIFLSSALSPIVNWLSVGGVPLVLSALIIYAGLIFVFGGLIYLIIPPISREVKELSANFPAYYQILRESFSALRASDFGSQLFGEIQDNLNFLSGNLQNAAAGLASAAGSFFGGVIVFFLVLVITFYMLVEENSLKKIIWSVAPEKHQIYLMQLISRMQKQIGSWLRGQLILSAVIFVMIYIGLSILGVKYALFLAILAGLIEFVPYLGPILASVPAIFIAFMQAPLLGLLTAVFYYFVQVTENNFIVPKVMQKMVGLNPVLIIIAILIGIKIAGPFGGALAVPMATVIAEIVKDVVDGRMVLPDGQAGPEADPPA